MLKLVRNKGYPCVKNKQLKKQNRALGWARNSPKRIVSGSSGDSLLQ